MCISPAVLNPGITEKEKYRGYRLEIDNKEIEVERDRDGRDRDREMVKIKIEI